MTKKKGKCGAIPTENMPKKSHETPKPPPRPSREIVKEVPSLVESRKYYKGLPDLCKRVKSLKTISEWTVEEGSDRIILRKRRIVFSCPNLKSLSMTVWDLPF